MSDEDYKKYNDNNSHGEIIIGSLLNHSLYDLSWGTLLPFQTNGDNRPSLDLSLFETKPNELIRDLTEIK